MLFVLEKLGGNGQFKFLQSNLYLSQGKCKMLKQSCMAKHLNFTSYFTINIVFFLFIIYTVMHSQARITEIKGDLYKHASSPDDVVFKSGF